MKSHYYPRGGWCPSCGKLLDGATGIDTNNLPAPGDVSVCIYCAAVLRFNARRTVELFPNWRTKLDAKGVASIARIVAGARAAMIERAIRA